MRDELVEAQFDYIALFHHDGLFPALAGALAEFAEHVAALVEAQDQFTAVLRQGRQLHQSPPEKKHALGGITEPIDQFALREAMPRAIHELIAKLSAKTA
jgi:hypothetical protein